MERPIVTLIFHLVIIVFVTVSCTICAGSDLSSPVTKLFEVIQSLQELDDSPFKPPLTWEKQKGMYQNEIRPNFHGSEKYALARDDLRIPDINLFTPTWVTLCLIESHQYGKAPKPSDLQINLVLDIMDKYRNKNVPYENSEMSFWPQIFNETVDFYQSTPKNMLGVMNLPDYLPEEDVEKILKFLRLYKLEKLYEGLMRRRNEYLNVFKIPPDFDDTFVNIGLGSLLVENGKYPAPSLQWRNQNKNLTSVFDSLKRYAYRPFSTAERINTIDTRSYFYMRDFIQQSHLSGTDLALVTTWLQDYDEVRQLFDQGVAMPFNVNNVDVTVASNVIYGITMVALTNVTEDPTLLIDGDVEKIFINTTSLIAHVISNNFTSRPDLVLTYYPSKYLFYWLVTRTYGYVNRFIIQRKEQSSIDPRLDKMVKTAYSILRPVLRSTMTEDILTSAKVDVYGTMYLDNFLGTDDLDIFNRTLNRAEDRIFTTAVSVAALINTWTLWDQGQLIWEIDTPVNVTQMVDKGVQWLNVNTFSGKYKPWNTFFSGSGKTLKSMPFFYPANRLEYFNGTHFKDDKFPAGLKYVIGFQGHVTSEEYAAMLKQPHFGMKTPMTFDGYNSEPGEFFPFWSSDAFTYGVTMVTLSQYDNIKK